MKPSFVATYAKPLSDTRGPCLDGCSGFGSRADCPPLIVLASRAESFRGDCCHHDSMDPGQGHSSADSTPGPDTANLASGRLRAGPVRVARFTHSFALTRPGETVIGGSVTSLELDQSWLERD